MAASTRAWPPSSQENCLRNSYSLCPRLGATGVADDARIADTVRCRAEEAGRAALVVHQDGHAPSGSLCGHQAEPLVQGGHDDGVHPFAVGQDFSRYVEAGLSVRAIRFVSLSWMVTASRMSTEATDLSRECVSR